MSKLSLAFANKRTKIIVVVVASMAIAFGGYTAYQSSAKEATTTSVSREETVQRGDLFQSLSEEGTASVSTTTTALDLNVSLDDDTKLDLSVEVDDILVRAGENVIQGQPLFILNQSSLNQALDTLQTEYQLATLNLNQAQLSLSLGMADASATLSSDKNLATIAGSTYESTVNQIEIKLQQYEKNVADTEEDLVYYQKLYNTYDERTANLALFERLMEAGEDNYDALKELYDDYIEDNSDVISSYNNAQKTTENLKETLENASAELSYYAQFEGNSEYTSIIQNAQNSYSSVASQFNAAVNIINTYGNVYNESTSLESRVETAKDALDAATETYNEYNSEYKEMYGTMGKSDISRKVAQLEIDLLTAKQTLADYQLNYTSNILEAENKYNKDVTTSSTADLTYSSTLNKLELAVISAQLKANNLASYVNELNSLLQDNVILSPCDGLITNISFSAGDKIDLVYNYITIAQADRISISLSIDQDDITSVSLDQPTLVTFDSAGATFDGYVDAISVSPASMGSPTVTYTVTVVVEGEGLEDIYEGMSCQIELITDQVSDVLYISKRAITTENRTSYVKVKQSDGSTAMQEIATGFTDGVSYEVTSGLNEGDIVIIESQISGSTGNNNITNSTMPTPGGGQMPSEGQVIPGDTSRNP